MPSLEVESVNSIRRDNRRASGSSASVPMSAWSKSFWAAELKGSRPRTRSRSHVLRNSTLRGCHRQLQRVKSRGFTAFERLVLPAQRANQDLKPPILVENHLRDPAPGERGGEISNQNRFTGT